MERLPAEAVKAARGDKIFNSIYGPDDRLARAWFAQWLLMQKASEARLKSISSDGARSDGMPYAAECLRGIGVLWGAAETFVPMMFKMIVYAQAGNWDGIAKLKEPHHG